MDSLTPTTVDLGTTLEELLLPIETDDVIALVAIGAAVEFPPDTTVEFTDDDAICVTMETFGDVVMVT